MPEALDKAARAERLHSTPAGAKLLLIARWLCERECFQELCCRRNPATMPTNHRKHGSNLSQPT